MLPSDFYILASFDLMPLNAQCHHIRVVAQRQFDIYNMLTLFQFF